MLCTLGNELRTLCPDARRVLVVLDSGATAHDPTEHLTRTGWNVSREIIDAAESRKTLATFEALVRRLAQERFERTDVVVSVGGGMVGDVAGFAAACYRRGIPIVQCPTTLLSMVDASVGGKTGVNLDFGTVGLLKNLVGAFHQPRAVVADLDTLHTLPDRDFAAGLGECIKHALICRSVARPDDDLLEWTRGCLAKARARDADTLEELVARNISLKSGVVTEDEREEAPDEAGGRALLNLGHTFGHVFETLTNLEEADHRPIELLHGEAVGLGLIAAAHAATKLFPASASVGEIVEEMLTTAGLPTRVGGLPSDEVLLERLAHDKKVRKGVVRVILPTSPGEAKVVHDPPTGVLKAGFAAVRV
jgi:3-dehydroquinate synthase